MKKLHGTLAALAAVTFLSTPSFAQTPPTHPPTQPEQEMAKQAAVEAPRTASLRGSIVSVDTDKMNLTIKDTAGVEHTFRYNPQTEVTGSQEGMAGLATKAGTNVTVHFKGDKGHKGDMMSDRATSESPARNDAKKARIATKIEVETL